MSRSNTGLVSLMVQDRSTGAFRDRFGLSPDEALAVLLLPVTYWFVTAYHQVEIGFFRWNWRAALLLLGVGVIAVKETGYEVTPFNFATGIARTLPVRLSMPLSGRAAAQWPGVEDVVDEPINSPAEGSEFSSSGKEDRQMGVVERDDGAKVTVIQALDRKTTVQDGDAWIQDAVAFAEGFEDHLASDNQRISCYIIGDDPDVSGEVSDFETLSDRDNSDEALFAAEASEHFRERARRSGSVDQGVYVVAVSESGAGTNGGLDALKHRVGVADGPDPQLEVLRQRTDNALAFVEAVGLSDRDEELPRVLNGDEAGDVLRHFWDRGATQGDGVDVTDAAVVGDTLARNEDVAEARGDEDAPNDEDDEADENGRLADTAGRLRTGIGGASKSATSTMRQLIWGPETVDEHRKFVEVNGEYRATLWMTGGPQSPPLGVLAELREMEGVRFDLAMHVDAPDRRGTAKSLEKKAERLKFSVAGAQSDDDEVRVEDAQGLRETVLALRNILLGTGDGTTEQSPAEVAIYATVRASTKRQLEEDVSKVKSRAKSSNLGLQFRVAADRQKHALRATAPTGEDAFNSSMRFKLAEHVQKFLKVSISIGTDTRVLVPSDTLGCFDFFTGGVRSDDGGSVWGMAEAIHPAVGAARPAGLLRISRGRLSAPHRYFVGRTGSGKTFFVTFLLIQELLLSRLPGRDRKRAVIIDIAENFDGVVKLFGGQKITPGETTLNPFAVSEDSIRLKDTINLIVDIVCIYLGENASEEFAQKARPLVRRFVRVTFEEHGIESIEDAHRESPTFDSFFDILRRLASEDDEHEGEIAGAAYAKEISLRHTEYEAEKYRKTAGDLLTKMAGFKEGDEFDFLVADPDDVDERESGIDGSAPVVLFDLSEYQDQSSNTAAKQISTRAILTTSFRWSSVLNEDVVTVVDEAHDVFAADQAERFESIVRAGRNVGMYFDFMSQADDDFDSSSARIIAKQCGIATALDMGTHKVNTQAIADTLGVTPYAAGMVRGDLEAGEDPEPYSEAIVNRDGETYRVRISVSAVMERIITYETEDGDWGEYLDAALLDAYSDAENGSGEQDGDDDEPRADAAASSQEVRA